MNVTDLICSTCAQTKECYKDVELFYDGDLPFLRRLSTGPSYSSHSRMLNSDEVVILIPHTGARYCDVVTECFECVGHLIVRRYDMLYIDGIPDLAGFNMIKGDTCALVLRDKKAINGCRVTPLNARQQELLLKAIYDDTDPNVAWVMR